jgi:predicted dehydrogenase
VTRFAFVGCGRVVEAFHLPALTKIDDVLLTALVDTDPGRARALAELPARRDLHRAPDGWL